jgi:hypothetical protein
MTHRATLKFTVVSRRLKLSLSILAAVLAAGSVTSAKAASVTVNAGQTVGYSGNQTFDSLSMRGGHFYWSHTLPETPAMTLNVLASANLSSGLIWFPSGTLVPLINFHSGAVIDGAGSNGVSGPMRIDGDPWDSFGLTVWNSGTFIQRGFYGELRFWGEVTFVNKPGATYDIQNNFGVYGGHFQIDPGAVLLKSNGSGTSEIGPSPVTNFGTISATRGTLWLSGGGTHTGATISALPPPGPLPPGFPVPLVLLSGAQTFNTVATAGNVALDVGAELTNLGPWRNSGRFTDAGPSGSIMFDGARGAGSLDNLSGGDLRIRGMLITNNMTTNALGGKITVSGGIGGGPEGSIDNSGDFVIDNGGSVWVPDFTNRDGTLVVNGTLTNTGGRTKLLGGILSGTGIINGDLFDGGGPGSAHFKPGNSPGTMTINGAFSLLPNGILDLEVESDGAGGILFDRLVADSVFLNGHVNLIVGEGVDESDVMGLSFFDLGGPSGVTYGSDFTWDFPDRPGSFLLPGPNGLQIMTLAPMVPEPDDLRHAAGRFWTAGFCRAAQDAKGDSSRSQLPQFRLQMTKSADTVLVPRFSCPSPGGVTCFFCPTYGSLRRVCSQLLSEADLAGNHGCPNLFLPNHWSRHVKSALLHVISLARLACVHTWAWAATRPSPRRSS